MSARRGVTVFLTLDALRPESNPASSGGAPGAGVVLPNKQ